MRQAIIRPDLLRVLACCAALLLGSVLPHALHAAEHHHHAACAAGEEKTALGGACHHGAAGDHGACPACSFLCQFHSGVPDTPGTVAQTRPVASVPTARPLARGRPCPPHLPRAPPASLTVTSV
jgi:hypothetical protein